MPLYTPLDTATSEIRLIELVSDEPHLPLRCRMTTFSLDSNPRFYALSYEWGDANEKSTVIINNGSLAVTRNLESALRHIRPHWTPSEPDDRFLLWADAACVNQDDLAERSHQVQLMHRVYTSARGVFCWLGTEGRTTAFGTCRTVASELHKATQDSIERGGLLDWLRHHPTLCEEGARVLRKLIDNDAWEAVRLMLRASYWKRVWVFQELVLSSNPIFFGTGAGHLEWQELQVCCEGLYDIYVAAANHSLAKPGFVSMTVWKTLTTPHVDLNLILDVAMCRKARQAAGESGVLDPKVGWWITMFARDLVATDPKDYIYGLLGISGIRLVPDYTSDTSLAKVYLDYCKGWLDVTRDAKLYNGQGSLYFLSHAGTGLGLNADLPSWAPNFPRKLSERIESGSADQGLFTAEDAMLYPYIMDETYSLFVPGVKVSSVVSVSEHPQLSTIMNGRLLDFMGDWAARQTSYVSGIPPLQAIFRVLTQNPSQDVNKHLVIQALAFLRVLHNPWKRDAEHRSIVADKFAALGLDLRSPDCNRAFETAFFPGLDYHNLGIEGDVLEHLTGRAQGAARNIEDAVLFKLLWFARDFRIFETSTGHLGLSPVGTKPGDVLCVLKHGDVPVVLRRDEAGSHYTLVGTAFVVGLMTGEAAGFCSKDGQRPDWFEIR
ncbi:heterokaryon incompatibility protein-domain-containing protein [Stachybotrys elegans]|uniref:Heterokaryon incompatibility protein-domain-containing protein n=1 Tax=Stachybotrys elegans TaxID=80388 RepID=A0A8K0T7D5_9HYPO|nr:heterokaryon incompatibility protein-domain-containing protein [Stachybotrys elegans]